MAMTTCKECKKEVSSKAKVCPHCGVKDPAVKLSDMIGGFVLLGVIIWGTVAFFSDDEPDTPEKTPEQIAQEKEACKSDLKCWGNEHNIKASLICQDYVEKLAKYSFEWTDGMIEPKFGSFRWLNPTEGTVTYVGDKIKLQNGFGAWQGYVYECDFDPLSETVLDIRATAGRL